jgi:hypothetical protein
MARKVTFNAQGNEALIERLLDGLDVEVVPAQPSGGYARLRAGGKTVASVHPRREYVRVFWGGASSSDAVKCEAGNLGPTRKRLAKLVAEAAGKPEPAPSSKRARSRQSVAP